jgi:hypothetical protein
MDFAMAIRTYNHTFCNFSFQGLQRQPIGYCISNVKLFETQVMKIHTNYILFITV